MTGISSQFDNLQSAIQFAEQSHSVIGQNLANVNTPNFKTQQLSFEELLSEFKQRQKGGLPINASFSLKEAAGLQERADGNNVDMDRELALLKKNTLAYQTLTQLLGAKMGILKQSIKS
ncbi:MAG: flagellar basal body rod protein FlgB [Mariniblastus sp.]